ncbi:UNVERIFIED_CONTAM: hypothetical protein K2H54_062126, partial [Gekko kuhli]
MLPVLPSLLFVPLLTCEEINWDDVITYPNNYYKPGDYLLAAVIPTKSDLYVTHDFYYDPAYDFIP